MTTRPTAVMCCSTSLAIPWALNILSRPAMAMRLIGITDPWLSAYPEDTVMAYRNPASGVWPDFFTSNDLQALIQTWGAEVSNLTKQWLGANVGTFAVQDHVARSVQVSASS